MYGSYAALVATAEIVFPPKIICFEHTKKYGHHDIHKLQIISFVEVEANSESE